VTVPLSRRANATEDTEMDPVGYSDTARILVGRWWSCLVTYVLRVTEKLGNLGR
jgi:hypothetical protein